jgi:hypothetical protein
MSYRTLEVELADGRVQARGKEKLPAKARALLTILDEAEVTGQPGVNLSLGALMKESRGSGRGQHTDLSTNKNHLVDFGR